MIKIFVLLTIMDITQSVDPRNNIFLELMNMSRNALFAGKNVCMPHAPSVRAGIPWVAHPISKCDTCTLFDHHTSGLYNKDTCHNVTIPPASSCCIPGFTCVQTWWSRTLGALIPSYGVMQALDQVRSLSDSVQKLANDTVLALGNIKDTLLPRTR